MIDRTINDPKYNLSSSTKSDKLLKKLKIGKKHFWT